MRLVATPARKELILHHLTSTVLAQETSTLKWGVWGGQMITGGGSDALCCRGCLVVQYMFLPPAGVFVFHRSRARNTHQSREQGRKGREGKGREERREGFQKKEGSKNETMDGVMHERISRSQL